MLRRLAKQTIIIIFLLPLLQSCSSSSTLDSLGSVLFEDHGFRKSCLVQSDIAALTTKYKLHQLLPKDIEPMNDDRVLAILKYFRGINEIIERVESSESREMLQKCFYDTLGGFLKHLMIPVVKYSFYAGNVTLSTAQKITNLYDRCKELLDTNGNTWSEPITDFSAFALRILPVSISSNENEAMKACANLMTGSDSDEMMVPLPRIETDSDDDGGDDEISTILKIPFRNEQSTFNINSKRAAFALFRYFVMATQCYVYQGIDPSTFNRKLKMWINENVLPFLDDDQLYPAFGACLRILESIRDSHDATYSGSKERKVKKHSLLRSNLLSTSLDDDDGGDFSFYDPDRDLYWWMNAFLASVGIFLLASLLVFLVAKICCNRRKIEQTESGGGGGRSLKEKIARILHSNTHVPERDDFYEYKKLPKSIRFENETVEEKKKKKNKRKLFARNKDKKKKEFDLPLLNYVSESDDEVLLNVSNMSSTSALSSAGTKPPDKPDIASKRKKMAQQRFRSKSPQPRK